MDDQFVKYYSDLTTAAPDHAKFEPDFASDADFRCTGDLDYPAAKTINILSPVSKKRASLNDRTKKSSTPSSDFEISTANKIYTKELISTNTVHRYRTEDLASYGFSTFDKDLHECLVTQKANRLKSKSAGTNSRNESSKPSGAVRFSEITIQEYSVKPGVNPGGSKGCPLTMGWNPISTDILDLDVFESLRCEHRRPTEQLKLVSSHRQHMLRGMGYTMKDIWGGTKAANLARRDRYSTIARLKSTPSQIRIEGIRRNVQNLVTFGSKKRREEKFLAPYVDAKNKTNSRLP